MSASVLHIVYGAGSGLVRRVIFPDDDVWRPHLMDGEALLTIDQLTFDGNVNDAIQSVSQAKAQLDGHLAQQSTVKADVVQFPNRFCVLDGNGMVVDVQITDPSIETPPDGCQFVQSDMGDVGYSYDGTDFTAPSPGNGNAL